MREIKFRAWSRENNRMTYSDEQGLYEFFYGISDGQTDGETLSQYTGLKDNNGKEIYEGDIVKEVFEHNELTDGDRELDYPDDTKWDKDGNLISYCEVVFRNGAFGLIDDVDDDAFESFDQMRGRTDAFEVYDCELVGNIYENKELLK